MKLMKEVTIDGYTFSTDKGKLDISYVHNFLSGKSYWAPGIPLDIVKRSIENSLCVGVYDQEKQIGFARFITDYATFGYLADVFIDEAYRGRSLSKRLVEFILAFDEFKCLRRILLFTKDAHSLYARYGFSALDFPDRAMNILRRDIYTL